MECLYYRSLIIHVILAALIVSWMQTGTTAQSPAPTQASTAPSTASPTTSSTAAPPTSSTAAPTTSSTPSTTTPAPTTSSTAAPTTSPTTSCPSPVLDVSRGPDTTQDIVFRITSLCAAGPFNIQATAQDGGTSFTLQLSAGSSVTQQGTPGNTYNISAPALTVNSDTIHLRPARVSNIGTKNENTEDLIVTWNQTINSFVDMYTVCIQTIKCENVNGNTNEQTFGGLSQGRDYIATVTASVRGLSGDTEQRTIHTAPGKLSGINYSASSASPVTVTWLPPAGDVDSYEVTWKVEKRSVRSPQYSLAATPGEKTALTIVCIYRNIRGDSFTGYVRLNPSVPVISLDGSPTTNVANVKITPASNSVQDTYDITYCRVQPAGVCTTESGSIGSSALTHPLQGQPGSLYNVTVQVKSNGQGSYSSNKLEFSTVPGKPNKPQVTSRTSSSLHVTWSATSAQTHYSVKWSKGGNPAGSHETQSTSYTITVPDSDSGYSYDVRITAITRYPGVTPQESVPSDPECATVRPALSPQCQLTEDSAQSNYNVSVIRISNCMKAKIDEWVLTFKRDNRVVFNTSQSSTTSQVSFSHHDGLVPGRKHEVSIVPRSRGTCTIPDVQSGAGISSPFTADPVKPVLVFDTNPTRIQVTLVLKAGYVHSYEVTATGPGLNTMKTGGNFTGSVVLIFNNTRPHSNYTISAKFYSEGRSKNSTAMEMVETKIAAPADIRNINFTVDSKNAPRNLSLSWKKPSLNGPFTAYQITYGFQTNNSEIMKINLTDEDKTIYTTNLQPGHEYYFQITTYNTEKASSPYVARHNLEVGEPQLGSVQFRPVQTSTLHDQLTIPIDKNVFSDRFGDVNMYQVMVQPDNSSYSSSNNYSWYDSHKQDFSLPYYTAAPCNFFNPNANCPGVVAANRGRQRRAASNTVNFVVGSQQCPTPPTSPYCNGPLQPSKSYFVRLYACSANNKCTPSAVSDQLRTGERPSEGDGPNVAAIVVPIVLVLVIGGAIAGFILYRRYHPAVPSAKPVPTVELRPVIKQPIPLDNFEEHFIEMSKDSHFKFAEEYEELKPVGVNQSKDASELVENRTKNRFVNILPYDHSRVKLISDDDEPGSDYINANYMPGHNSKREFIVTQGPLASTQDDFWRMVWEQECRAIVMLTKCVEKGKEKCSYYWPQDSNPAAYGDIEIVINNETKTDDWNITKMRMNKADEDQGRSITHFHYTAWPDFGVPSNHQSLIRFVRAVRSQLTRSGGPIVVHCSAGVGRSGTFIVLDRCLQLIREQDSVDVYNIVREMRTFRGLMVQTEPQYILIHKCLLCVLKGEENSDLNDVGLSNEAFEADDEGVTVEITN